MVVLRQSLVRSGPRNLLSDLLDIYLSLFLGAFSGALLLHGGNLWTAFHDLLIGRLIPSLAAPDPAPFVEHDDPQAAVAGRLGREQSAHAGTKQNDIHV